MRSYDYVVYVRRAVFFDRRETPNEKPRPAHLVQRQESQDRLEDRFRDQDRRERHPVSELLVLGFGDGGNAVILPPDRRRNGQRYRGHRRVNERDRVARQFRAGPVHEQHRSQQDDAQQYLESAQTGNRFHPSKCCVPRFGSVVQRAVDDVHHQLDFRSTGHGGAHYNIARSRIAVVVCDQNIIERRITQQCYRREENATYFYDRKSLVNIGKEIIKRFFR